MKKIYTFLLYNMCLEDQKNKPCANTTFCNGYFFLKIFDLLKTITAKKLMQVPNCRCWRLPEISIRHKIHSFIQFYIMFKNEIIRYLYSNLSIFEVIRFFTCWNQNNPYAAYFPTVCQHFTFLDGTQISIPTWKEQIYYTYLRRNTCRSIGGTQNSRTIFQAQV